MMSDANRRVIYDKVADNVKANISDINKVLSNCSIESKFATESNEEKFKKILCINTESIFKNTPTSEYYDLDKVSAILEMLDGGKTSGGSRKAAVARTDSVSSLNSVNTDEEADSLAELMSQMKEMRDTLSGIENTRIDYPNLNEMRVAETERNNKFLELVFSLQSTARELTLIASTDKQNKEELPSGVIDSQFIERLTKLDKCLGDMLELEKNKNPISNVQKKQDLKIEMSSIMNTILQALKDHSL